MLLISIPDNTALADTIAEVFRGTAYGTTSPSLLRMILSWFDKFLQSVLGTMASNPLAQTIVRWTLVIAALLIVARIAFAVVMHYRNRDRHTLQWTRGNGPYDPWSDAQQFAQSGRYTDAAHALYGALLLGMARRGRLTLHESKTAGDYTRELGGGPSTRQFRDFARRYETVVYGIGRCDSATYAELRELALPLVDAQRA
jgi:hypothetical protein